MTTQSRWNYCTVLAALSTIMIHSSLIVRASPMVPFDWTATDCSAYPFAGAGGFAFCGVLEFCKRGTVGELYGYKQGGKSDANCTSPGPLIRVKPGVKYLMTFRNSVRGTTSNIHTHGMHISGDGNGDNILLYAEADECIHYVWDVPSNHMGGTHWYHSHKHQSSSFQVANGAHGMFVVDDDVTSIIPTGTPGFVPIARFLENDIQVQYVHNFFDEWAANGDIGGTTLEVYANEWTRLRLSLSNPYQSDPGTNSQAVSLTPSVCDSYVIAYDGVYLVDVPGKKLPVNITGAGRLDIAIKCGPTSGNSASFKYGSREIATIKTIAGGAAGSARAPTPFAENDELWQPVRPFYLRDLRNLTEVDNSFVVNLTNFVINGKKWKVEEPLATFDITETNEWTIIGSQRHPLHIHVHHFQVVAPCGGHEVGAWYDTVAGIENCTVRFAYDDFAGTTILHCHDLDHEDSGMISTIQINGGGFETTNPDFEDRQCYGQTPSPTSSPIPFSCRSQSQLNCENRLGRSGRWMYIGESPADRSCRQKCATQDSEIDGDTAWQCGTCARVGDGNLCSDLEKCTNSLGIQGYYIRKGFGTSNCRYTCARYDSFRLQFGGWECGYC